MKLIKPEYIFLDFVAKTKISALKEIAKKATSLLVANDSEKLYEALLKREQEFSTGFENSFAIPHARGNTITKPALFFIKLKNKIDWKSVDRKLTKYLFVILIPEENKNNQHLEVLSKVSTMMLEKSFINKIKTLKTKEAISKLILDHLEDQPENQKVEKSNKENKFIVALTACPVGVAHTYLAAEKINEAAKKMGYSIKIETHGSAGIKNQLSDEDIKNADLVLVASDIGLNLDRFKNKKIFASSIKPAIHKPEKLIKQAFNEAQIKVLDSSTKIEDDKNPSQKSLMKHILAGISYMVPFVILGGICIALSLGIAKIIYGNESTAPKGDFLWYLEQIGATAFNLMIGVLGAYIANSIAGRAAIAPAFIVSIIANTASTLYPIGGIEVKTAMGFVGSILFGISIGYTVKWINSWNINKNISAVMPIFVIPLGVGLFYSLIAIFVVGAPIGWIMDKFIHSLEAILNGNTSLNIGVGIGFGILFGAMAGFDMGGQLIKWLF